MLHAITQRKTNFHLRYLGHREEGERRITAEDEITALLLGPLAFMPYADIATFWKAIVGQPKCWSWPQGEVDVATMSFWERRKTAAGPIEADLLVEFRWPDGERRILLIELKWRSGLSGDNQLYDQWERYLRDDERPAALHLFIAPQVGDALQAQAKTHIWDGGYLLPISWQQVLSRLPHQNHGSPGLVRLVKQMEATLKMLQIRPFKGFSTLSPPALPPVNAPIFWRENPPIQELQ
jgi:hypothetical protein